MEGKVGDQGSSNRLLSQDLPISVNLLAPGEVQSDSHYSGMTNDESSLSSTNDLTTGCF